IVGSLLALVVFVWLLAPHVWLALNTVSTDDAYVNGHVTSVAPRVAGQVARVLVDDNYRVKKGDLLVQLDKEPYQVQVNIKQALVDTAQADVTAAEAQVRGIEAQARSLRWKLQDAVEQVDNRVAALRAAVATMESKIATRDRARADFRRSERLIRTRAITDEEYDQRRENLKVAESLVSEAREQVYQIRVELGLPPRPEKSDDLTSVPEDLNQTSSSIRMALAELVQTTASIGLPLAKSNATPQQVIDEFIQKDEDGDIDRILERLVPDAPAVKQANAKLLQAKRDLDQAKLNLRYCDVLAEIDGVVTRRNVNPGNNVQIGQSLMAVRSTTEIWIDANFKETELADLRIGQRAEIYVDMYGGRKSFEGRITGFSMGTGSTLALLPPQNATGNFVKIVQRLPVRIELTEPPPDDMPLFIGLSVVPYVYFKERPSGPHAGERLQTYVRR
ncbi:MAG TPA: HlyD family secretion protein, partial [Pirellulales bacterium]